MGVEVEEYHDTILHCESSNLQGMKQLRGMTAIGLRIYCGTSGRPLRRGEVADALGGFVLYTLVSTSRSLNVVVGPLTRHDSKWRR